MKQKQKEAEQKEAGQRGAGQRGQDTGVRARKQREGAIIWVVAEKKVTRKSGVCLFIFGA